MTVELTPMFDPHDELQLLALIEGELSDAEAQAVRARLAGESTAGGSTSGGAERRASGGALIEGMIRDRELLRSDPEPLLPLNFMERVEPLLARPMLMDALHDAALPDAPAATSAATSRPGGFRRMHLRQARRRRAVRFALAAGIGLAAIAGVWSAAQIALPPAWSPSAWLAGTATEDHDQRGDGEGGSVKAPQVVGWPQGDGALHHFLPQRRAESFAAGGTTLEKPRDRSAGTREAQLVLLVQAADAAGAEETMQRLLAGLDERLALVQNFSYAEARDLERQWLLARGEADPAQPRRAARDGRASASSDGPRSRRLDEMAERVRQQIQASRRGERGPQPDVTGSRQLLGPRESAASFEAQLEYSSRGATHTITIPAGRLDELLAAMSAAPGQRTVLQPLHDAGVEPAGAGDRRASRAAGNELNWLENLPRLREVLAELAADDPATLIHLPVIVQPAP